MHGCDFRTELRLVTQDAFIDCGAPEAAVKIAKTSSTRLFSIGDGGRRADNCGLLDLSSFHIPKTEEKQTIFL